MKLQGIVQPFIALTRFVQLRSGWLILLLVLLVNPVLLPGQPTAEDSKGWQIAGAWSALQDPQLDVQRRAIEKLVELEAFSHSSGKEDYPRMKQCILELQKSSEYRDQAVAALAMGYATRGLPENAAELLGQLAENDAAEVAVEALGKLARTSDPARHKLRQLAQESRSGHAMIEAALVLNRLEPNSQLPASTLIYLVTDGGQHWAVPAAERLGELQLSLKEKADAVNALTEHLATALLDHYDQAQVARAIIRLDPDSEEARRQLVDLYSNDAVASNVREMAAVAVVQFVPEARDAALAAIVKMAESNDIYISNLYELATVSHELITATIVMSQDDDEAVRAEANAALSQWAGNTIAPDRVAARLSEIAKDKTCESYQRAEAVEALGRVAPRLVDTSFIALTLNELVLDPGLGERPHRTARLRAEAAVVLLQLVPDAPNKAQLIQLLNEATQIDSTQVHLAAARVFHLLDDDSQHAIVTRLIQDIVEDDSFEEDSRKVLTQFGPLGNRNVLAILAGLYKRRDFTHELRFLAYFTGGGDDNVNRMVRRLGAEDSYPSTASRQARMDSLAAVVAAWEDAKEHPDLHEELAKHVTQVIRQGDWSDAADIEFLETWQTRLQVAGFEDRRLAVGDLITKLRGPSKLADPTQWLKGLASVLLLHLCFWLALITAYPRSRHVQAIFFWNAWVRRIVGFAYVGWLLAWVPQLRRILFAPFREALLADAAIDELNGAKYYTDLQVRDFSNGKVLPIETAIPDLRGRVLLEGESGLGKSMFARRSAQQSKKRIVVFLLAEKCSRGVIRAIQDKLHGPAMDQAYLSTLIYSGCIDVVIDGLNEVDPNTRARIGNFVEKNASGNVMLTSQPIDWKPPAGIQQFAMQPLQETAIEEFLHAQMDADLSTHDRLEFKQRTTSYLLQSLDPKQSPEALDANRRILSNPMDLTLVANLIADGQQPDLFRLQQQLFEVMAAEYARTQVGTPFPEEFAEAVYRMRREGRSEIPSQQFAVELSCMQRYKMVVLRHATDSAGHNAARWYFRHDKIMDFFVVQTFMQNTDRLEQHLNDSRFRGVYFLLATLLPFDAAMKLREQLIQQAARTNDTSLLRPFVELVNVRKAA